MLCAMNMCQGNSQTSTDHNTPEWDINDNHIPKVRVFSLVILKVMQKLFESEIKKFFYHSNDSIDSSNAVKCLISISISTSL